MTRNTTNSVTSRASAALRRQTYVRAPSVYMTNSTAPTPRNRREATVTGTCCMGNQKYLFVLIRSAIHDGLLPAYGCAIPPVSSPHRVPYTDTLRTYQGRT